MWLDIIASSSQKLFKIPGCWNYDRCVCTYNGKYLGLPLRLKNKTWTFVVQLYDPPNYWQAVFLKVEQLSDCQQRVIANH
jgi:hypothetical protein